VTLQVEGPAPKDRPEAAATTQLSKPSLTKAADTPEAAWFRDAMTTLGVLAHTGVEFTSEDLLMLVGDPMRARQVGAVFGVAQRQHKIVATGATVGRERLLRVWRGAR
jgi:hypothetical protein